MAGRIRTLRDLDLMEGAAPAEPTGRIPKMTIHHIPNLDDSDACRRMLVRIHKEFYPIMERRGYRVLTLSEMCCCGDGLDHDQEMDENTTTTTANRTNHARPTKKRKGRRRRRKLKVMARNILGYNRTHSNGTHDIHLRLRDARRHNVLIPYEDVAGTMAHELAHCEHGPHNAKFYKLMDEILEQHATFMARGIVADDKGFPMDSQQSYTLGGGGGVGAGPPQSGAAGRAAQARQERAKWMPQGPQKLGGDDQFKQWLLPGQAAGMAAEARRLLDEQWCQPCSEIIQVSDDSDEEDSSGCDSAIADTGSTKDPPVQEQDGKPAAVERRDATSGNTATHAIDLTLSDSDNDDGPSTNISSAVSRAPAALKKTTGLANHNTRDGINEWACVQCTLVNPPLALVCGACGMEAQSEEDTLKVANALLREDKIQHIKETEVERAEQEFGFNIYGTGNKTSSGTMKHLT